ncbi:hypothetical protein SY88_17935 [Clostridiales bacterium PH28_bin88]|nr:hypothetical protein SY88_17935 [Clostridiales bacterium PH28_bin88]
MSKKPLASALVAATLFVFIFGLGGQAVATTKYAGDTGKSCNFCHSNIPELNNTGKQFKANGYSLTAPASQPAKPAAQPTKPATKPAAPANQAPAKSKFRDMANHPAKAEVEFLADKKIIAGYPDGTYRPNQSITQHQFTELARRVLGVSMADPQAKFLEGWHYSKDPITRETAVEIVIRALGQADSAKAMPVEDKLNLLSLIKDGDSVSESKAPFVALALKRDLVNSETLADKLFQPQRNMTRGEAAVLIYAFYNAR